jgi:hypothetical protein
MGALGGLLPAVVLAVRPALARAAPKPLHWARGAGQGERRGRLSSFAVDKARFP